MSAPRRYSIVQGTPGYGWHVFEELPAGGKRIVGGPYTTQNEAQSAADRRNRDLVLATLLDADPADSSPATMQDVASVVGALVSQTELNGKVSRALEALSLQADKYDAQIADIEAKYDELRGLVLGIARQVDGLAGSGSVRA